MRRFHLVDISDLLVVDWLLVNCSVYYGPLICTVSQCFVHVLSVQLCIVCDICGLSDLDDSVWLILVYRTDDVKVDVMCLMCATQFICCRTALLCSSTAAQAANSRQL